MKIFKNQSKTGEGFYYSTTFYDKAQDGTESKKYVNINFQRGLEPSDNLDGEFVFKAADGQEYDVMLKAFTKQDGTVEPKFFFWKKGFKSEEGSSNNFGGNASFETQEMDDDLPF